MCFRVKQHHGRMCVQQLDCSIRRRTTGSACEQQVEIVHRPVKIYLLDLPVYTQLPLLLTLKLSQQSHEEDTRQVTGSSISGKHLGELSPDWTDTAAPPLPSEADGVL